LTNDSQDVIQKLKTVIIVVQKLDAQPLKPALVLTKNWAFAHFSLHFYFSKNYHWALTLASASETLVEILELFKKKICLVLWASCTKMKNYFQCAHIFRHFHSKKKTFLRI